MFFFKQKSAYEMRISDWSSDVCSSDLHVAASRNVDERGADQAASAAFGDGDAAPGGAVRVEDGRGGGFARSKARFGIGQQLKSPEAVTWRWPVRRSLPGGR